MSGATPVLLIGIDAAEVTLIEKLCSAGKLPVLQSLRERGCFGMLETQPHGFLSMVWPTFYNSKNVSHHGWYFNKMWRPDRMRLEFANEEWLPQRPFWQFLDPSRFRVALLDIPFTPRPEESLNGVYLNGWQNHDDFGKFSRPDDLWRQLKKKFGHPAMRAEFFGHQSAKSLLRLRQEMLGATEQISRISEYLLDGDPWDLFLVVLGGAHRGSHYLWNLSQIETQGLASETRRTLENALVELYQSWDRAIGRLINKAPDGTKIMVFALHGMGPNTGWSERFGEIVSQIQRSGAAAPQKSGLIYRLKRALPWKLVRQVTTRLPTSVNHLLVPLWSARMFNWRTTRYFPLPLDLNGYLRINLKGRESQGIVEPGEEYEALCREIEEAFLSFRDIETGEPIVEAVDRVDDLVPADAPCRHLLPDLIVRWGRTSSLETSGIRSEKYGELRWDPSAPLPSGRSGNHLDNGWFVAAGEGIRSGTRSDGHDTLDLIPTVFRWLGVEPPVEFQGQPIPVLCEGIAGPQHESRFAMAPTRRE